MKILDALKRKPVSEEHRVPARVRSPEGFCQKCYEGFLLRKDVIARMKSGWAAYAFIDGGYVRCVCEPAESED